MYILQQFLTQTPIWVWLLLALLTSIGLNQTRTRTVSRTRVVLVPVLLKAFSLFGTVSVFSGSALAIGAWLLAVGSTLAVTWGMPVHTDTRYDPVTRAFHLPGSWLPFTVILGVFCVKYPAGVLQSMQSPLLHNLALMLPASILTGILSGLLSARGIRLMRFAATTTATANRPAATGATATASSTLSLTAPALSPAPAPAPSPAPATESPVQHGASCTAPTAPPASGFTQANSPSVGSDRIHRQFA